jgi:hypothetical protein
MGHIGYYRNGSWNAVCDQCGRPFKAEALGRDGQTRGALRVCQECWDPLHPQELLRPVADPKPITWSRPWAPASYVQDVQESVRVVDGSLIGSTSLG